MKSAYLCIVKLSEYFDAITEISFVPFDNDADPVANPGGDYRDAESLPAESLPQKAVLLLENAPPHPDEKLLAFYDGLITGKFLPPISQQQYSLWVKV
ncbi:hypothetical protein AVEN_166664-1 [Araneus ventricosus]|uniref:Uncharacterized protein n=1 Tax=Araneus ventricosus TaxID=182803 RepID=A0A4Y2JNJ6_ARAVE|nr:hypothetical protein AVEN_166664-1 [Araneus ventricosus]